MILPGAGLKEVDSDRIFDSIFGGRAPGGALGTQDGSIDINMNSAFSPIPTCRAYPNNGSM